MPEEPKDVISESSAESPASEAVSPGPEGARPERPVENLAAEVHRRFGKLQQQLDTLMQVVATQQQPRPAPAEKGDPTDEELFSLMQQGDRNAFNLYLRREIDRGGQTQARAFEQQRIVDSQLSILAAKYPVWNDATHPLTQLANSIYQMLVSRGAPADRATLLEAMKTAIADRPDLVSELHQKSQPVSLRRERTQAGVTGTTVREESAAFKSKALTPEQVRLAQRIGSKDPAGAMERFWKRQDQGQSVLGAVSNYVKED